MPAVAPARGSIRADEVVSPRALCQRLGIGRHTLAAMRRRGLRPIRLGRSMVYRGRDVVALIDAMADDQQRDEWRR